MLRTDNAESLAAEGAIMNDLVPKTIADAIYLTEALGVDYLWVDALCIVQDDIADKKVQIGHMHAIYQMAFVTVIAASGKNADAGLPGLWPGTRSSVQEEITIKEPTDTDPGISLLTTISPLKIPTYHYLTPTTWNSRGWTMQERVLSRRILVFTEEQVYFTCNKGRFCEESYFEHPSIQFVRFHANAQELTFQNILRAAYESTDPVERFWRRYRSLVNDFTRRNFTFNGDVYDGFLAIATGLSQISEETFLWGLPRSRFEFGLWWTTFSGQSRRSSLSTLPMTSLNIKVQFPSWSWMGWVGEAWVSVGDDRWEMGESPEITCYVHQLSPLQVTKVGSTDILNRTSQIIEGGGNVMELRAQWKPNHVTDISLNDIKTHLKSVYDKLPELPEEQTIFFWSSLAVFTLQPAPEQESKNVGPIILNDSGSPVGTMGVMKEEHWKAGNYDRGKHEFIVIGSRCFFGVDPTLVVLQIERKGDVVFRVNIGDINEEAWVKAQRKWALIALQ
jgi:hypothetical protein